MNELWPGITLKIGPKTDKAMKFLIIPLTPKILLVILLNICQIVRVMIVWRIWYWISIIRITYLLGIELIL